MPERDGAAGAGRGPAVAAATDERLSGHRDVWVRKPVLRAVYGHYYRRILSNCVPGRSLEIGGGPGNLKRHVPDVVSVDILPTSWLDARADAQRLPFADESFDNLILVDVLHHLESPAEFFSEAQRVLRDRGRVVMVEPGITPVLEVVPPRAGTHAGRPPCARRVGGRSP